MTMLDFKIKVVTVTCISWFSDFASYLEDFWLVVFGLTALSDNISVYIRPSPKEREKEEKG